MLSRLVIACVIGILVFLACTLVGGLLVTTAVSFVVTVGQFLKDFASLLGLLAALWSFFVGGFSFPRKV
jgi:uncharacterized membrane-anchored protein